MWFCRTGIYSEQRFSSYVWYPTLCRGAGSQRQHTAASVAAVNQPPARPLDTVMLSDEWRIHEYNFRVRWLQEVRWRRSKKKTAREMNLAIKENTENISFHSLVIYSHLHWTCPRASSFTTRAGGEDHHLCRGLGVPGWLSVVRLMTPRRSQRMWKLPSFIN